MFRSAASHEEFGPTKKQLLEEKINKEYEEGGFAPQAARDADIWYKTLTEKATDHLEQQRIDILRRIFCVIRNGGLIFRSDNKGENWKWFADSNLPLATALSHGSRIMIQLDKSHVGGKKRKMSNFLQFSSRSELTTDETDHNHAFWNWLLTGDPDGKLRDVVSTDSDSSVAEKNNKVVFYRAGATHSIKYDKYALNSNDLNIYNRESSLIKLDGGISVKKEIYEVKEKIGVNSRNTKLFGTDILSKHRHWGMNLSIGGAGNSSFGVLDEPISSDGRNGHMYLYYMSPGENRFGGIMIGVEGSEFGKCSQTGDAHSIKAESSLLGVTLGYKWNNLLKMKCDGVGHGIPDKYDSLFIDLSGTVGLKQMREAMESWEDEFVKEPPERVSQQFNF
jgi:hypothetical protein